MKIRLTILDTDQLYLDTIAKAINNKLTDKLEIYSFTEEELALADLGKNKIDVFLADEKFQIDLDDIPEKCAFGYLSSSNNIKSLYEQKTLGKYQRLDVLYREIWNLYCEKRGGDIGIGWGDKGDSGQLISFASPAGGAGSSSMATACAINLAGKGKKVFYLNFELFGSSQLFFQAEGEGTLSDILFAVKMKTGNLGARLQGAIKKDITGVYFLESSPLALDVAEVSSADMMTIIQEIQGLNYYDYIIMDGDFTLEKKFLQLVRRSKHLVIVVDGSKAADFKFEKMYRSLEIIQEKEDMLLLPKIKVIYNQISNQNSRQLTHLDVSVIGGVPKYEDASPRQILKQLSIKKFFEQLI